MSICLLVVPVVSSPGLLATGGEDETEDGDDRDGDAGAMRASGAHDVLLSDSRRFTTAHDPETDYVIRVSPTRG